MIPPRMDDLLQNLALILLMGSILLRLDALFFLYKKRGEVDVLPGLILSLLAPVVGLSVFGYVTSKGFDDESRGRTGVGRAFKGFLLFLISQMAAGWFFLSVTFVSLLTVPTGRAVGPVASAEGFAHLELLLILAASASIGLSLFWIFYGGFDLKSMIQGRKVGMYSAISFFIFLVLSTSLTFKS